MRTPSGPLDQVVQIAQLLDELGIEYALGGSLAASFFGEPRATMDIDIAIQADPTLGAALVERAEPLFYVPHQTARLAFEERDSFNLIPHDTNMKIDIFVLGDSVLDRRQIERRRRIALSDSGPQLWVTSPEDQILRKLSWHRDSGSDTQWRDVIGILRVSGSHLDDADLHAAAEDLGLSDALERALAEARLTEP